MKITVIGSGSIFFTRAIIKGIIELPELDVAELALVDTNPRRCEQMGRFGQKALQEAEIATELTYTTDRREALPGTDYVVMTFAERNAHYRGVGAHIARNYGIVQASGDTAGPGCVFRTLRTVPVVLEVARDVEALCPDAWVFSLTNPTNIIGTAMDRYANIKHYAFCDSMYLAYEGADDGSLYGKIARYAELDVTPSLATMNRFKARIGGINHFVWMDELEFDGEDVWDRFRRGLKKAAQDEGVGSDTYAEWQLTEIFGAYPTVVYHTKEYVRYFQGRGSRLERDYVLTPWDLNARIRWTRQVWRDLARCNAGELPVGEILRDQRVDMLCYVMDSMNRDLNYQFPVNVRNEGIISNLPDDVLVEVFGSFDSNGASVPPYGVLPRGVLGMVQQVVDYQELCLEAAMSGGDYGKIVRAVAADPLVMSLSDAKSIAYDFMASDEENMDDKWDAYWANGEAGDRMFMPLD